MVMKEYEITVTNKPQLTPMQFHNMCYRFFREIKEDIESGKFKPIQSKKENWKWKIDWF